MTEGYTTMGSDEQTETEPWGDAPTDEAAQFFQDTIGDWWCRDCATDFAVDSVLDVNRRLDRSVSCPLCGGSDVGRRETLRVVLTNK